MPDFRDQFQDLTEGILNLERSCNAHLGEGSPQQLEPPTQTNPQSHLNGDLAKGGLRIKIPNPRSLGPSDLRSTVLEASTLPSGFYTDPGQPFPRKLNKIVFKVYDLETLKIELSMCLNLQGIVINRG